ncbi:O-antigen ligase family protein [Marinifilum caeruleilacunae]|uniref:O-antigen ligase domain-containing protein n=1 Tax=Marinifilum caeruleilacunae TaxID=2499076 RepID=A0ABX1WT53_9BACT|nr:O-antigen ligase family protein [Marinifilum caeruleilacunae]NOU59277.1 O-antigen ligase domain-containing protein [Marinifilum caeruleilacunae]
MKYIEIGFWFLIFFVAFYLKAYTVGGQEMVYLWKLPLLLFLISRVVGQETRYAFLILAYLFAAKNLVNVSFFKFPVDSIINFIKYLTIPLFVHWLYLNINSVGALKRLRLIPVYMAAFFIICNVPYYFGVFSAPVTTMLWMEDTKLDGLIGFLGAPHYTSAVLAVACVVLVDFLVKRRGDLRINLIVIPILLVGVFFLFKTYTRTGWLMFVVGILVLFLRRISFKDLGKIAAVGVVLVIGLSVLFQTNEGFRRRIMDDRAGQEDKSAYETVGSGRLQIAEIYLENLYQSNFVTYLVGMGMEESQRRYEKKDGMPLFAHNGFIQTLVDNGLIGFALYLLFLITLYRAISGSQSSHNQLTVSVFFMFLSCLATQQANYFLVDVFLSIYIGIALIENRINQYVDYKRKSEAYEDLEHTAPAYRR